MTTAVALLREAVATAHSQPVASLLTIAMTGGMCVAVLLTTGRTVAAENAVLAQIDAAGTRSIVVRADADAGVTVDLLDHLQAVDGIEAVTGFGPIVDYRNAAVAGGAKVAVRSGYGSIGDRQLLAPPGSDFVGGDTALASAEASRVLGLRDGTGALIADSGAGVVVTGQLDVPDHLAFLEPLAVVPSSTSEQPSGADSDDPLAVLVMLADTPEQVATVATTVQGFVESADRTRITIETSEELAAIRAAVNGELGRYGRSAVLVILAIATVLVAVNMLALVAMRRKDFGRRRALGGTQSLIIALLLAQVALLASVGAALGITGTVAALTSMDSPTPRVAYMLALAVAAVLTAVAAALLPAVMAARRDPLHELRIP